ncbi:MAG: NAD+ synthase [Thermoplasmata archaeon]
MNLVPHLQPHAEETIHQFLRHHAQGAGRGGVVIGLSGGIDSALVARLARDALGPSRVLGVLLPDAAYAPPLLEETMAYARGLGIGVRRIPIDSVEEAIRPLVPNADDQVAWGNVKARVRMILNYATAREVGFRVAGTGNKSEILLGYFTKYGDGGVDLVPIGDLYKTEVRELAQRLELPGPIRERAPTAGLWEGQTDEGELGVAYAEIDRILYGMEQLRTPSEIHGLTGIPNDVIDRIVLRVEQNRHKRRPPPIPKIGLRTIGIDWRD